MSDETTELLPCPFCGGEAMPVKQIEGRYAIARYSVSCNGCGLVAFYEATEAEAIAAWNTRAELWSGTLTAEQVREAIEKRFDFDVWVPPARWQAIADELNARAERTCHNTHENRWFKCSACGYGFTDLYAEDEGDINEQPRYCPNCGAKVIGG